MEVAKVADLEASMKSNILLSNNSKIFKQELVQHFMCDDILMTFKWMHCDDGVIIY